MSEHKTTSGPFGLSMGMSLDQLEAEPIDDVVGKYMLTSVPKPHSAFEGYVVKVGTNSGLSWVKAIGNEIETNAYGTELRLVFDSMKEKLEKSYGKSRLVDGLLPDSVWSDRRDWMDGILNKERVLMSVWSTSDGSNLKNDLGLIVLSVDASETNTGWILVEYHFNNKEECEAEIAALEDDAL